MRISAILLLIVAATVRADVPDLLVTVSGKPTRVRLAIEAEGFAPETAWNAFFDKLFDYFDRDGNGTLSAAEAARIFPLPLADGKNAKADFSAMDANRDAKVSREEFKAYYRRSGFTPIVVTVMPPLPESARSNETLFRLLDRDGDGKLTRAKLSRAPDLLSRLDENEDDALTVAEVLAYPLSDPPHSERSVTVVATNSTTPDMEIRTKLFADGRIQMIVPVGEKSGKTSATFVPASGVSPGDFAATRQFYLSALGSRESVERKQLEDDASLQLLQTLFDAADRNGDGKLTATELTAFLALMESGAACQTFITITDRGPNLFDLIDENGDGRLDLGELNRAAKLLPAGSWSRTDIPRRFPISVVRGRASGLFGPVSLATRSKPKVAPSVATARGPRWFLAMDRNRDGFVSASEFQGPIELFRRMDLDGDGRISVEEAQKADVAIPPRP